MPFAIVVLAVGTFLMGTTEFIIAGLLPEIAHDLNVSVADAGLLIAVFAIGMIVGNADDDDRDVAAAAAADAGRGADCVRRRAPGRGGRVGFGLLLAARFVTASATGAFWAVAAVVAARAAGPGASSPAIGIVLGGGMLANVVGVPLGAFAGQLIGWRGPFWVLAGLAIVTAILVPQFVPHDDAGQPQRSITSEFASLRSLPVWLALLSCTLIMGGVLAAYTSSPHCSSTAPDCPATWCRWPWSASVSAR